MARRRSTFNAPINAHFTTPDTRCRERSERPARLVRGYHARRSARFTPPGIVHIRPPVPARPASRRCNTTTSLAEPYPNEHDVQLARRHGDAPQPMPSLGSGTPRWPRAPPATCRSRACLLRALFFSVSAGSCMRRRGTCTVTSTQAGKDTTTRLRRLRPRRHLRPGPCVRRLASPRSPDRKHAHRLDLTLTGVRLRLGTVREFGGAAARPPTVR